MSFCRSFSSPLGEMLMASDGKALTGLCFAGQKHSPDSTGFVRAELEVFRMTESWLEEYFSGGIPSFIPPLSLTGSDFRLLIWNELLKIPYGSTLSYGELARCAAKSMGRQHMSAQAVGGAVGRNPISIIVPCHRVVGAGGALVGYAAGTDRKERLLLLENTCIQSHRWEKA